MNQLAKLYNNVRRVLKARGYTAAETQTQMIEAGLIPDTRVVKRGVK